MCPQLVFGSPHARSQRDDRGGTFTPSGVRHRDDRCFQNSWMLCKGLLHFDRRDVLTAGDDEVLGSVAYLDVAVGIANGEVTSTEPAVRYRCRGCYFVAKVASHDVVAANGDLSECGAIGGDLCAVLVNYPDLLGHDVAHTLPRVELVPHLLGQRIPLRMPVVDDDGAIRLGHAV